MTDEEVEEWDYKYYTKEITQEEWLEGFRKADITPDDYKIIKRNNAMRRLLLLIICVLSIWLSFLMITKV